MFSIRLLTHAVLLSATVNWPVTAYAELGGSAATVKADGVRIGGQMSTASTGSYTRYRLERSNGGTVHEMTNAAGQVFAISWSGPGKPDLRSLLGDHFEAYQGANRAMHSLRRPPQVNQPNLQIQTEGHMGWFRGIAFIPSLAPPGFSAGDLMKEP